MNQYILRRAEDRGTYSNSWLKSNFSFSFSDYYDPEHMHQGYLRVLNDDIIAGKSGFPSHPHRNMEIISVVLKGGLLHKDSMGTEGIIKPGEIQMMSAGTGVLHSEENPFDEDVHLLQLWVLPNQHNTKPSYESKKYENSKIENAWLKNAGPNKVVFSVQIKQDLNLYLAKIKKGTELEKQPDFVKSADYLFIIDGKLKLENLKLKSKDAVYMQIEEKFVLQAEEDSFVLFSSSKLL